MSYIHFKTVYNLNYDKVAFDGTSISLQELKKLIADKIKLSKKLDFDLEISNAETNQVYRENDLILKNTRVIVKRVIKNSTIPLRAQSPVVPTNVASSQLISNLPPLVAKSVNAKSKSASPSNSVTKLAESVITPLPKTTYDSLAPLNLPSKPIIYIEEAKKSEITEIDSRLDERAKLESFLMNSMTSSPTTENQTRLCGFSKTWQKQVNPLQKSIPPGYVCVICKKPGHLKQLCPEAGLIPRPEERPKFPSGIPRTNLRPAQPGDKFAMLGPEGYVVTEIDQEAAKIVKKDRIFFENEEEIENIEKLESQDSKTDEIPIELKCPFGDHIIKDAVLVPCCGNFVCCDECIRKKIIDEEPIICPNKKCDQEIGPLVSITPFHETRKKVQDYLKTKQNIIQSETKTDIFLDLILNDVNEKDIKTGGQSPVQDNKISSSELSQQLITASAESQRLSSALLPTPPSTPFVDTCQIRTQQPFSNYQYRARFLGQKVYQPQIYTNQGYTPFVPRAQFYAHQRPHHFVRPQIPGYPEMGFYPPISQNIPTVHPYQGVMTESQFYEYQESLKKEKERESRVEKKEVRKRTKSKSKERYRRSRSRSRYREKYKSRHRSRSRSRGRSRSRSKLRDRYKRSRTPEFKHKKRRSRSRSRSSSVKKTTTRSKSRDRKTKSRSMSRSTTTTTDSLTSGKYKEKKTKNKAKKKKDKK